MHPARRTAIFAAMNILSILIGLVALVFVIPGLIPLLGVFNYIAIPIAVVGAAAGILSSRTSGRNFNLFVLVVAVIRLSLGGGLI
ncbi:putative membrane protein [Sphingomonas jinjuensis]|uniref:Putative membrane protein n=2 Tax=Sphingomonas jinjuensis TaxID=535907 RepID=A0A840FAX5_9SPHN|nr:putative membrane protein [Sphingomonas jinjuensis]